MNAKQVVFVTPVGDGLEDDAVEVDTDELCAEGRPPHRVVGGLAEAGRFVAARFPERRPVVLVDRDARPWEVEEQVNEFERARREALASVGGAR